MEEDYEYSNKFGKQGRKNPRNIITITHERLYSCKIYAHPQSFGISIMRGCA